jgi:hypothetical protein
MDKALFDEFLGTVNPTTTSAEDIAIFPNPANGAEYASAWLFFIHLNEGILFMI